MDTKSLIADAKARFIHNLAKAQLKDKYDGKLIVADQGGLWKATPELISFLNSFTDDELVLTDNFDNPVKVERETLLNVLKQTYQKSMEAWYNEWKDIESKR